MHYLAVNPVAAPRLGIVILISHMVGQRLREPRTFCKATQLRRDMNEPRTKLYCQHFHKRNVQSAGKTVEERLVFG